MTSSSDTFPFGIADVVELLGLTVRRRLPSKIGRASCRERV